MAVDKSNPPTGALTLIANVNGNKLYRCEGGNWNGDFWYELEDGERGFVDTMFSLEDEAELVTGFIQDYS